MSLDDPRTDAERARAECFVIAYRAPGVMWRTHSGALGAVARDELLASLAASYPGLELKAVRLETGSPASSSPVPLLLIVTAALLLLWRSGSWVPLSSMRHRPRQAVTR